MLTSLAQACTVEDWVIDTAYREINTIVNLHEFPIPWGLFYGPGQYQPTATSKLEVLSNYIKVAKHLLPKEETLRGAIMWWRNLPASNIFINVEQPSKIVGIIGWQSVDVSPLFQQARRPALIDVHGPIPKGYGSIELPANLEELSIDEQMKARRLQAEQFVYQYYEDLSRKRNRNISHALDCRKTFPTSIHGMIDKVFNDGETILNGQLIAVESEWLNIVGPGPDGKPSVPCPLSFSEQEKSLQCRQQAQWDQGCQLLQTVCGELGVGRLWRGYVNHAGYESMKVKLENCLKHFLDREAQGDVQRTEWIKAWPFAKHPILPSIRRYTPPPNLNLEGHVPVSDPSTLSNLEGHVPKSDSSGLLNLEEHVPKNDSSTLSNLEGHVSKNDFSTLLNFEGPVSKNIPSILLNFEELVPTNDPSASLNLEEHVPENDPSTLLNLEGHVPENDPPALLNLEGDVPENDPPVLLNLEGHVPENDPPILLNLEGHVAESDPPTLCDEDLAILFGLPPF